ncbi:hypothetical protein EDC01DRAFT_375729 [Geopyxis carbonaria]|nr:hypothetical protein EDC01DRAFT_375729 [Geopyxis carbonaria]
MSSEGRPSERSNSSSASGPYGPKNNLHSSTEPTFKTSNAPKFGSTTPMKAHLPRASIQQENQQPDQAGYQPHVSKVQARAAELLQPVRIADWRKPVIDLTKGSRNNDAPQIIPRPTDQPTFSAGARDQAYSGFASVNAGVPQNFVDLTRNATPSAYPVYQGDTSYRDPAYKSFGEYVDPEKTTKDLKELLEGFNDDEPVKPPKKKKTKKVKKTKKKPSKEEEELATMMEGAALEDDDVIPPIEDAVPRVSKYDRRRSTKKKKKKKTKTKTTITLKGLLCVFCLIKSAV